MAYANEIIVVCVNNTIRVKFDPSTNDLSANFDGHYYGLENSIADYVAARTGESCRDSPTNRPRTSFFFASYHSEE